MNPHFKQPIAWVALSAWVGAFALAPKVAGAAALVIVIAYWLKRRNK